MRVAILDDYQGVALQFADWSGLELTAFTDHVASDDALAERLAAYEAVVAMRERTPFTAARLARLPQLRLLVTTGMANASIDLDAARRHGVTVCGTGGLASPTAELTWGLILALARRIPAEDAAVRAGGWQHTIGPELAGRTLGVIGHGRLGSRVAAIGRAFEMRILTWSQNLREAEGATVVSKDELLERSDVVSIHLRLSERSRGLIGAPELARMKPTALLINTSRGPIVDEAALLQALRAGTIGGAGLDVYDTEPLPAGHPLRSAPNTVLTPHIGYVSTGTYERFYADAAEDVRAFAAGAPVRVLS
ncbi:D-2-hydroxyacid dehydrogenase family protein [Candidatus Solirubrobacter pratensis]|uniref:D-2-hydroxyacid dehydrogenase family protein n=1 Tax=Candidatus Solirubrobacter pratensis TaxID=1298857 RepID=UPI00041DD656|nr:D-2-hydroxyacid dehydrogenase family protein [Candidatus Solirubrobacter pratensis]